MAVFRRQKLKACSFLVTNTMIQRSFPPLSGKNCPNLVKSCQVCPLKSRKYTKLWKLYNSTATSYSWQNCAFNYSLAWVSTVLRQMTLTSPIALREERVVLVMYRSNRSFNIPPRTTPWAFDFFENYCSNFPLPGPKCRSNAPHQGPFR